MAATLPPKRLVNLCWLSTEWRSCLLISREMPVVLILLSLLSRLVSAPANGPGWLGAKTAPYEVAARSPSEFTDDLTEDWTVLKLGFLLKLGCMLRASDLKVIGWLVALVLLRARYFRSFPRRASFLGRDG